MLSLMQVWPSGQRIVPLPLIRSAAAAASEKLILAADRYYYFLLLC